MEPGSCHMDDCPEACDDVLNIATAEETTLVDAVSSGRLDHDDLGTFLAHADTAAHDVDRGLVRLVKIITALLEKHGV